jgi:thiol-disulfide isomerase/thioredoxin
MIERSLIDTDGAPDDRRVRKRSSLGALGALAISPTALGASLWAGSSMRPGPALAQANPNAGNAGLTPQSASLPARDAPAIGSPIAFPRTRLIDGTEREPGFWAGKLVVLELWATWCPFCRKQNPVLDQLYREHQSKGLEVLGLSIDRTEDEIKKYYAETGYRFPSARFDRSWWDAIGKPKGLPIVWVVGRNGRLLQVEIGEMFAEDIQDLARLL